MLRGAPPAAGPTGTTGRALATLELHGTVRIGTAGCGLNRDHGQCTGRVSISAPPAARPFGNRGPRAGRRSCATRSRSYASTHAHLGTAGRETLWGPRAASGPEELRDSERTYASTHAYLGTAGCGTRKGTVGCERAEGAA